MTADEPITITLTRDEALVLNDLLSDFRDEPAVTIAHPAQRRALWNLACLLEKALPDAFAPDYKLRIEAAKLHLADKEYIWLTRNPDPLVIAVYKAASIREDSKFAHRLPNAFEEGVRRI